MRPGNGANDVMRMLDAPIQSRRRFVERILERLLTACDRDDIGAHQPHAKDIQALASHVLGAHVNIALQPKQRRDGGGGNAVLPGARLRDHPLLAHAHGEQRLADGVIDFVGAGVIQIFALEINLAAAEMFGQPRAK